MTFAYSSSDWVKFYSLFYNTLHICYNRLFNNTLYSHHKSNWSTYIRFHLICHICYTVINFLITPFTAITRVNGPPTANFIRFVAAVIIMITLPLLRNTLAILTLELLACTIFGQYCAYQNNTCTCTELVLKHNLIIIQSTK